jgi:hypothetical protein
MVKSSKAQREQTQPPAPPGESAPEPAPETQAVANALVQLGEDADPKRVAAAVRAQARSRQFCEAGLPEIGRSG